MWVGVSGSTPTSVKEKKNMHLGKFTVTIRDSTNRVAAIFIEELSYWLRTPHAIVVYKFRFYYVRAKNSRNTKLVLFRNA